MLYEVITVLQILALLGPAVAIAHRLSTVRKADQIVCLREGSIIELGSHEELLGLNRNNFV